MNQNFINLLPKELQATICKMYDLILERSLLRAYQNLDDEQKSMMATIFDSGTKEEKNNFLNTYLGNLQNLMIEETQRLTKELQK